MLNTQKNLIIACGALAKEIHTLIEINQWNIFDVTCLPALFHNFPEKIIPNLERKINAAQLSQKYSKIIVAYGDCGTGGKLDNFLKSKNIQRILGDHCYEFYAGAQSFKKYMNLSLIHI